jgi:hypothetical protein
MEWIGAAGSGANTHGRHAMADGTIFSDDKSSPQGCDPNRNFRDAEPPLGSAQPGRKQGVRHGIARMRRHVAPARLLC